ncbi:MAG: aldehyde dehydrogenase family protein [Chloroflexota bacterium]
MDVLNCIDGAWFKADVPEHYDVMNPATGELLARTPLSGSAEVAGASAAAARALPDWRQTPVQERVQYLFKLRDLLLKDMETIARTITNEAGKTLDEAKAEMVRAIEELIEAGATQGAKIPVDGRGAVVKGYEKGSFVRPTVLADLPPQTETVRTEIFGPVPGLIHVDTVDEAIALVNAGQYGNQASLFTSSGAAARKFRYEAQAGDIGINFGVAAPMAFFPFGGWRESFFGDLHGQGMDAVDFFTQK